MQIDALLAAPETPQGPLWRRSVVLLRELALGHAAIAAQDWRRAAESLARAEAGAQDYKQGRLHIELLGLRAWVLDRCGEKSLPLLREAVDLAAAYGLLRVFDDAHPALGDWVREALPGLSSPPPGGPGRSRRRRARRRPPRAAARTRATPSMALTPKEREVLQLLARNLSNKEIGLAMQVGEETIKWHMKNLFAKLDAGTRKQVVQRSRILGLLESRSLEPSGGDPPGLATGPGRLLPLRGRPRRASITLRPETVAPRRPWRQAHDHRHRNRRPSSAPARSPTRSRSSRSPAPSAPSCPT